MSRASLLHCLRNKVHHESRIMLVVKVKEEVIGTSLLTTFMLM